MDIALRKKLAAECLGTFCMVFAGTGAIVINDISGGVITHVGIALTFGLIVFAMIAAVGDVSGAHLNPAVTVGFVLARRMSARVGGPYIGAQVAGALLASVILRLLFPDHPTLGATVPSGAVHQSFVLELLMTAILMYVILSVTIGAKEKGITAGLTIGGVIGLEALFGGPVSGASMNPARSLAPALVSGEIGSVWIYLIAPVIGAWLAVPVCRGIREPGCCAAGSPADAL